VADFTGVLAEPMVQLTLYYYSASYTGAHEHSQNIGCSASGAFLEFGISTGIHIIVDKDRAAKLFRQSRAEWKMVKVQVGRLDDNAGPPIERTGRAYSHRIQLIGAKTRTLQRFGAGLHDPLKDGFGTELRLGLVASAADEVARLVQDGSVYFCASKIQTQYESLH